MFEHREMTNAELHERLNQISATVQRIRWQDGREAYYHAKRWASEQNKPIRQELKRRLQGSSPSSLVASGAGLGNSAPEAEYVKLTLPTGWNGYAYEGTRGARVLNQCPICGAKLNYWRQGYDGTWFDNVHGCANGHQLKITDDDLVAPRNSAPEADDLCMECGRATSCNNDGDECDDLLDWVREGSDEDEDRRALMSEFRPIGGC